LNRSSQEETEDETKAEQNKFHLTLVMLLGEKIATMRFNFLNRYRQNIVVSYPGVVRDSIVTNASQLQTDPPALVI